MTAPARARAEEARLPQLLLLGLWAAAVLAGGLRQEAVWLVWCAAFWALAWRYPPDGEAVRRADLWWAWAGWVLLSCVFSMEPLVSMSHAWRRATTVLFLTLAWSWWGTRDRARWVVSLHLLAVVLGAAWAWGQLSGRAPAGLLPPNPNYTACFLAAAAAACYWTAPEERGAAKLGWLLAGTAYLAVVLWMRSRGAVVAVAASAAVWALANRSFKPPLAAAALGLLLFAASPAGYLSSLVKLDDPMAYERPWLWAAALRIALAHPFLGVGPGMFEQGYYLHREPFLKDWAWHSRFSTHAHSEPLQIAAETGWLGLGFLAFAFVFFLPKARPGDRPARAAAGALWAVLAHGAVDGVLFLPAIELLFFGALACASDWPRPFFRRGPPRLGRLALAGLALSVLTWWPGYQAVRRQLEGAEPSRPAQERIASLKEALRVRPRDSFLRGMLAGLYLSERPSRPALALWELDRALDSNPSHALFAAQRAELLLRMGDPAAALAAAQRARALEPNFVGAYLVAGEAALALGRRPQAEAAVTRIRETLAAGHVPRSRFERLLLDLPPARFERLAAAASR